MSVYFHWVRDLSGQVTLRFRVSEYSHIRTSSDLVYTCILTLSTTCGDPYPGGWGVPSVQENYTFKISRRNYVKNVHTLYPLVFLGSKFIP